MDWDEIRLFLEVARAEGLSGAARRTGISAPTLGRRMNALEEGTGARLFERRQTGYGLTESGQALYRRAIEMESAAGEIERWRTLNARRVVRISAGSWTTRFIARRIDRLWPGEENLGIELITAHARADIGHRQADIGIRNRAPDDARLAGRRLQDVAHAVYRARAGAGSRDDLPWIAVTGDAAITPSARWVRANHLDRTVLTCSDARVVLDLVRTGAGQAVLPCFVGDEESNLVRDGNPVGELRSEQWLVLHGETRHEPAVRTVIDRLAALQESERALFVGERPQPASAGEL